MVWKFNDEQPIYQQIISQIKERIVAGGHGWRQNERTGGKLPDRRRYRRQLRGASCGKKDRKWESERLCGAVGALDLPCLRAEAGGK